MKGGQEGLAEMSRALSALEGSPATAGLYGRLADSYRKTGRPEEGLTTVATALTETERSGERTAETELYKVKGEPSQALSVQRPPPKNP
jgi:hypothetical protein